MDRSGEAGVGDRSGDKRGGLALYRVAWDKVTMWNDDEDEDEVDEAPLSFEDDRWIWAMSLSYCWSLADVLCIFSNNVG